MIYSANPNTLDFLQKTSDDSSSHIIKNELFNEVEIEIITSCDSAFVEDKENSEEINSLLKNLSQQTDCDSNDENSGSQDEIRRILSRKTSSVGIETSKSGTTCRHISLVGKILLSDNYIISEIVCPIKNNRLMPVRVSNPLYKNLDFDR